MVTTMCHDFLGPCPKSLHSYSFPFPFPLALSPLLPFAALDVESHTRRSHRQSLVSATETKTPEGLGKLGSTPAEVVRITGRAIISTAARSL